MRILTLDTATRRGLVAAVDGEVVASAHHDRPMAHAERLFGMIDEVLAAARWEAEQVDLLAVGMGPGSFTGVRVGMAAAKGIGFAMNIPLVGVVSLAAMASAGRRVGPAPILAMLDAKKGEVFIAGYDQAGNAIGGPDHIPRGEVDAWIARLGLHQPTLRAVGDVVGELSLSNIQWVRGPECDLPGPNATARLAQAAWESVPNDQLDTLEPLYVRPPDITLPANPPTSNSTTGRHSA